MKILADASLPGLHHFFPKPFELSLYHHPQELPSLLSGQDILLCRASLKVTQELLAQTHSLRFVATASSGSDHIDESYLERRAIKLIDAKGSNAIAVADYVIATLVFLQKYKGFSGSKAGVIGLGEVGSRVAQRLRAAGMTVLCNDPPKAELDLNFINSSLEELTDCDLISLHANLHDASPFPSRNLIDARLLKQLKPSMVIINAARGGIVDEEAIVNQNKLIYCTDVYNNEPHIYKKIIDHATLCTPHIAGHSIEAKFRAVAMVSEKLHQYFNLKPPARKFPVISKPIQPPIPNWQDLILSLYNPLNETTALKSASNLELSFNNLRKSHQNRHDFCSYLIESASQEIQQLLGINPAN
ncbi:MAG: 4-phosphoerythronate dehydrogenase [Tatlockia sp.]|nr:4-phosphoerythronate dehydrogenase [Tatlockia sp.]